MRPVLAALAPLAAASLLTSSASAQTRPRVHAASPAVSPDGQRIAFMASRDGSTDDLYVIGQDGSGEVRLTQSPESEGRPRWAKDGKHVLFALSAGDTSRLFTVGIDDHKPQQVATVRGRNPVPLGDGKQVLVSTGDWVHMQLAVTDLAGSPPKQISNGVGAIWNATVSPDGAHIAYTLADSTQQLQVWVMDVDGGNAHQVTHFAPADGRPQCPAWSPDGKRLAIQANSGDLKNGKKHFAHLWILDLQTGTATKLADHDQPYLDELPTWFPDGKRLAFQSNRSGAMEIWVMDVDGGNARQVTR